jgi:hypothetical protein
VRERTIWRVLRKVSIEFIKLLVKEFVLLDVGGGKQKALNDIKMMKLNDMDIGKSGPVGVAWICWVWDQGDLLDRDVVSYDC